MLSLLAFIYFSWLGCATRFWLHDGCASSVFDRLFNAWWDSNTSLCFIVYMCFFQIFLIAALPLLSLFIDFSPFNDIFLAFYAFIYSTDTQASRVSLDNRFNGQDIIWLSFLKLLLPMPSPILISALLPFTFAHLFRRADAIYIWCIRLVPTLLLH